MLLKFVILTLLLHGLAGAQTLPPVAQPPGERHNPPPTVRPGDLPPPVPHPYQPGLRAPSIMPEALSARELQEIAEPRNLRWREAIETEFAEWWERHRCFPNPRRQVAWFDQLADRLGVARPQEEHVLYGLVMERVELYSPVAVKPGLLEGMEEWLGDVLGWEVAGELFCTRR